LAFAFAALPALAGQSPALDYDYFKTKVQPIFVAKRPGHARCISCHGQGTPLRLQPLAPGAASWSEEESQKNFAAIKRVASAGDRSRLILHPLDENAGGDFFHSGGKHWTSQSDPEWQVLKAFVEGATK
jgi:cytochrome c553